MIFWDTSAVVPLVVEAFLRHALRAADALQLAAALTWARGGPSGHRLATLDGRLREAARGEGFAVELYEAGE